MANRFHPSTRNLFFLQARCLDRINSESKLKDLEKKEAHFLRKINIITKKVDAITFDFLWDRKTP